MDPEAPALAPRAAPFVIAVAFSSALLFLVQPFAARELLPAAGGSPEVWNACVLFFQGALLGGYLWAHFLCRRLPLRAAIAAHLALGAAAVAGGAPLPPLGVPQPGGEALFVLRHLAANLGLPLLFLSATTPLVVRLAQVSLPALEARILFAASNLAALAGLLLEPLFLAPRFGLAVHRSALELSLWLQGGLVALAALPSLRRPVGRDEPPPALLPRRLRKALGCAGLAALAASLALGVTRHLATDIAPHPLLFAAPLSLYLLTFVVAFGAAPGSLRRIHPLAGPVAIVLLVLSVAWWWLPASASLLLHLGVFFVLALTVHTRLAELKPSQGGLSGYWAALAAGGAAAGLAHTFLFPRLFDALYEYPLAIAGAVLVRDRTVALFSPTRRRLRASAVDAATLLLALLFVPWNERHVVLGTRTVLRERTWFGLHRVLVDEDGSLVRYHHGTTLHGLEARERPGFPAGYYHPGTLAGRPLSDMAGDERRRDVFVVGLGAGTLAAYCREGDRFTFAEIDPVSERIARRWFRYIGQARGNVEVVLGDGRRVLERRPDRSIGILVLDAFSSDAVPTHLLTREAFDLYFRKLSLGGILLVHVSNRHVDLARAVARVAHGLSLVAYLDPGRRPEGELRSICLAAPWVAVVASPFDLPLDPGAGEIERMPVRLADPLWTDDRTDLLAYLRWRWR